MVLHRVTSSFRLIVVMVRRAVMLSGWSLKLSGLKFVVTVFDDISIMWVFRVEVVDSVVIREPSPPILRRLDGRANESELIPMITACVFVTVWCILDLAMDNMYLSFDYAHSELL